jgi:hypothetical protein
MNHCEDFQKYSQFVGNGTFVVVFEDFHLHVETARPKQEIPVCVLRHQFGVIAMFNFNLRNRLEDFWILLVVPYVTSGSTAMFIFPFTSKCPSC